MSFLDIKPSTPTVPKFQSAEHPSVALLEDAARSYDARLAANPRDSFLTGKASVCRDIAAKLRKFGTFASPSQEGYAQKLVDWSKPRQPVEARTTEAAAIIHATPALPKLFSLMQRLSKLTIGKLQIIRKNQDSLCWIKHEDAEKVVGRLTESGVMTLWQRPMVDLQEVSCALLLIELDPERAAVEHGKLSGRCAVCSRDLTDPESIERGIGPVCADKF